MTRKKTIVVPLNDEFTPMTNCDLFYFVLRFYSFENTWWIRDNDGKWRISSFSNFAYTKMKNDPLTFNPTHWIHHKGLNIILLRRRLKCIWISQTDIDHWLQLEEGIVYYHKDQMNQFYIPNRSFSHTRPGLKLCFL